MSLIRYPGSKAKLVKSILAKFPDVMSLPLFMTADTPEYREPFFGAGAVGFEVIDRLPPKADVWINDKDYSIFCLWLSVKNDHIGLIEKIDKFEPSVEKFNEFKLSDNDKSIEPTEKGFRKLALHQMSFSGLGAMSGGPLGGSTQDNDKYNVFCRWSPPLLISEVIRLHHILTKVDAKITCKDFQEVIDAPGKCFIYADPPYWVQGPNLYVHAMTESDHRRLSSSLRNSKNEWVLSYDDCVEVRELYRGCWVSELEITYTMTETSEKRPKNKEILVSSNSS